MINMHKKYEKPIIPTAKGRAKITDNSGDTENKNENYEINFNLYIYKKKCTVGCDRIT